MKSVLKNASRLPLAPTMAGLFGLVAAILVMATPRALLWTVVSKTGINNVIPSAAPPLGMTAKLMLGSVAFIVVAALAFIIAKVIEKRMGGTARRRGFGDAKTTQEVAAVAPAAKTSAAETSRRRPIIAGQELGAPFMSDEALAEAPINTEFDAQPEYAQPEYATPAYMQDEFMTEGFVQNDYAPVEAMPVEAIPDAPVPVPVQEEEPLTLGLNSLADSVPFARSVDSFADHHAVEMPVVHAPEPTVSEPTFNPYANREDAYAPVETDNSGFEDTYDTPQQSPEPVYHAPVAIEPVPAPVSDYAVPEFAVPTYDHYEPEVEPAAVASVDHNDQHNEKVSISELVARFEQGMAQLARLTQEERDHAARQAQPHREGTPIALHEALGRLEKLAGGQRL
jgi:hypothetical protein